MKNQNKTFAFKLAQKNQEVNSEQKWQVRKDVTTAGCSGPWARASDRRFGRDNGMWC